MFRKRSWSITWGPTSSNESPDDEGTETWASPDDDPPRWPIDEQREPRRRGDWKPPGTLCARYVPTVDVDRATRAPTTRGLETACAMRAPQVAHPRSRSNESPDDEGTETTRPPLVRMVLSRNFASNESPDDEGTETLRSHIGEQHPAQSAATRAPTTRGLETRMSPITGRCCAATHRATRAPTTRGLETRDRAVPARGLQRHEQIESPRLRRGDWKQPRRSPWKPMKA